MLITWQWRKFAELTLDELYNILALRQEVFILEQNCLYPDIDYKDQQALHLLGRNDKQILCYLRLFPKDFIYPNSITFGRIVTSPLIRGTGVAKEAMRQLLQYTEANHPQTDIIISAQLYLKNFYETYGFHSVNDVYDEDGIPHIQMCKSL